MADVKGTKAILQKLKAVIVDGSSLDPGMKDEMNKLGNTLQLIDAVLMDVETMQEHSSEPVKLWLRDIAYDAEDILDEFEAMHRSEKEARQRSKVRNYILSSSNQLASRQKMAHKMKHINNAVVEILRNRSMFQLENTNKKESNESSMVRSTTSPFINSDDTVGRKNEKSELVDLLIRPSTSSSSSSNNPNALREDIKLYVLPIVGMAGLGKTTLAQLVYNDESICQHFQLRIWVYASADFNIEKILVRIMESITSTKCNLSNFSVLVDRVKEQLCDKKFLLVLDDLWNQIAGDWGKLRSILIVGSEGSKVLVTTRSTSVASIVGGFIFPPYNLTHLSVNECWSIIKKIVFQPGGAVEVPEMVDIGKEIAKKCCGLPLVARVLGSWMHRKNREFDWLSIRDTEIVELPELQRLVIPSLKLSYNHLSSNLKQCFSYCSLFTRGWEIDREALIQLWMAEGFLPPPTSGNGYPAEEDIGNEYFLTLVSESFFQIVEKDEFGYIQKCKMNDFVHGLAQAVSSKEQCSILDANEVMDISNIRRLHLLFDEDTPKVFLNSTKKLRTFIATEVSDFRRIESVFDIKNLRVLYMSKSSVQRLPDSISKLIHLRYLNLSGSYNLEELQGSFTSLQNLQTLVLHNCGGLAYLPRDFGLMTSLRHLDLSSTRLKVFPRSFTNLVNLRTLDISHCYYFERFPDNIGDLRELRSLDVSHTNVSTLPQSIKNLTNLVELRLQACPNLKELPR